MSKKKYLIETSAVPAAMRQSTPNHSRMYDELVSDGEVWTSVYIRMEFVRRWIKYFFRLAFTLQHFQNLADAIRHENQSFSIRDVKAITEAIASLLDGVGSLSAQTAAEEVIRVAIWKLRKFDRLFRRRTANSCACQIGATNLRVDFNTLWDDVRGFLKATGNVEGCPINSFLSFKPLSDASRLINAPDAAQISAVESLRKICETKKAIDCKNCKKIGDAVIAMDQPRSWCLIHIDEAFIPLCATLQKRTKKLASERRAESDVPRLPDS